MIAPVIVSRCHLLIDKPFVKSKQLSGLIIIFITTGGKPEQKVEWFRQAQTQEAKRVVQQAFDNRVKKKVEMVEAGNHQAAVDGKTESTGRPIKKPVAPGVGSSSIQHSSRKRAASPKIIPSGSEDELARPAFKKPKVEKGSTSVNVSTRFDLVRDNHQDLLVLSPATKRALKETHLQQGVSNVDSVDRYTWPGNPAISEFESDRIVEKNRFSVYRVDRSLAQLADIVIPAARLGIRGAVTVIKGSPSDRLASRLSPYLWEKVSGIPRTFWLAVQPDMSNLQPGEHQLKAAEGKASKGHIVRYTAKDAVETSDTTKALLANRTQPSRKLGGNGLEAHRQDSDDDEHFEDQSDKSDQTFKESEQLGNRNSLVARKQPPIPPPNKQEKPSNHTADAPEHRHTKHVSVTGQLGANLDALTDAVNNIRDWQSNVLSENLDALGMLGTMSQKCKRLGKALEKMQLASNSEVWMAFSDLKADFDVTDSLESLKSPAARQPSEKP